MKRLIRVILAVTPWLIIAGLLWAGLFIKPQPVGQTVQPPVLEQRDYYYGLAVLPGQKRWLAGSNGKIIQIDGEGRITLLAPGHKQTLQDIAVWDETQSVAVGNEGIILRSADGGKSWQEVPDVPKSEIANKLNRVRLGPNGLAIATGEMGALLETTDYGQHWRRLRPEEDQAWNDVALLADGKLLAVGEFGHIAISHDGGATWADSKTPVEVSLMSVAFRDPKNGLAVGLEGTVLLTADGGESWTQLETTAREHLYDITWDAAHNHWIGAGSLGRWLTVATDGQIASGRLDAQDLTWHVRAVPEGDIVWFVGANVGRWDGKTWSPLGESWQPRALMGLPVNADKNSDKKNEQAEAKK
ncbi:MAG: glycosyl hydrolase [Azonexus sp.]|jgi:photosystem II stability/assembly factor-like uncharacterized protein|nr:glycosyl hydrolase [Azonexus sp.]